MDILTSLFCGLGFCLLIMIYILSRSDTDVHTDTQIADISFIKQKCEKKQENYLSNSIIAYLWE